MVSRRLGPMVSLAVLGLVTTCGPSGATFQDGGANSDATFIPVDADLRDGFTMGDGGGSDALAGCDPQNFVLQKAPPAQVYLVIDKSGSMNEPSATPGLSRWEELNQAMDWTLSQFDGAIEFGLLTYPEGGECSTAGPEIRFGLNNRLDILTTLGLSTPAGGTPTAAALNNAAASLRDFGTPGSPWLIILATDGGPNCNYMLDALPACSCTYASSDYCCTNFPAACLFGNTCLDDLSTLSVVTALHNDASPIDTVVIGLAGTSEYENLLDNLAVAGGRPQVGGSHSFYPAANQTELQDALEAIAVSVITCEIQLERAPDYPDLVRVYIDGAEIPRDTGHFNGWDYANAEFTSIELFGAACDTLQDGDNHNLTATFACIID